MTMIGKRRPDENAAKDRPGRPSRDMAFVLTTQQNYDHLAWFDVIRDTGGLMAIGVALLCFLAGVPVALTLLPVVWGGWRFFSRWWAFAPAMREEGARHCVVLFGRGGYWHRAEYIRGKGEVVGVLTDRHGPIKAGVAGHILDAIENANWGEQSDSDQPREIIRAVRTYRRRPRIRSPFVWYPRTSAGYAAHMLGIQVGDVRTPKDLADYCEAGGDKDPAAQGMVSPGYS